MQDFMRIVSSRYALKYAVKCYFLSKKHEIIEKKTELFQFNVGFVWFCKQMLFEIVLSTVVNCFYANFAI